MTLTLVVVVLLAVALLPSALNIPQSNPNTVPEYAPVPPDDDSRTSQQGNLAALGQAGGGSRLTAEISPPPPLLQTSGQRRSGKKCVGNPPRQTEDPLSPPCVAFFEGNNGGATHVGVTRDEVQILFTEFSAPVEQGGGRCPTSRGCEPPPDRGYVDLAKPPQQDEYIYTRMLRLWQTHFNDRYQTFGRFVHFWIHYNNSSGPEGRRADAKDNFDTVRPFAVLDYRAANAAAYLQAMAERGVSNFLPSGTYTVGGQPSEYLRKYPGLVWGYDPTVEIRARNFSSYVCSQVVPFNASFSGNTDELGRTENGKPRRLGLLWTTDSFSPQLKVYADIVRREVSACGGNFVADESFPDWCFDISCRGVDPTPAQLIAAEFQREKVSTIIWTGGPNNNISNAAGRIGYFPEVIIGGDNAIDATFEGQWHDKNFWSRAYAFSTYVKQNPFEDTPCMLAAFEADPRAPRQDVRDFVASSSMLSDSYSRGSRWRGQGSLPPLWTEDFMQFPRSRVRIPVCPPAFTWPATTPVPKMPLRSGGIPPGMTRNRAALDVGD